MKALCRFGAVVALVLLEAWRAGGVWGADSTWEEDIRAFETADRTHPPPRGAVLFIGSSSIRLWATLAQDFPEFPVINRGFGGSQIADSTSFAERIVIPYKPKMVVMYAGGMDVLSGKTPAQVCADFEAFAAKVHGALPDVPIVYISVNPAKAFWKDIAAMRELNRRVAEYVRGKPRLAFIDSHSKMLAPDGRWRDDLLREDGLHLNAKGYQLWRGIIKPELLRLLPQAGSGELRRQEDAGGRR